MSRERALFERIAMPQDRPRSARTAEQDLDALLESVRINLQRVLASRHGMCETLDDYGLPALADIVVSGDTHLHVLREAIEVAIEKYEPRLRRVKVSIAPRESEREKAIFRIEGLLVSSSGEHRVRYDTSVQGGGEFLVSG